MATQKQDVNVALAYALCGLGWFGVCGLHRLYLGKRVSGVIWLVTFGCFGIGQWIDLALIPAIAQERQRTLAGGSTPATASETSQAYIGLIAQVWQAWQHRQEDPMQQLLQTAMANGNQLSLGRVILETGMAPDAAEKLLLEATRRGLAHVGNDPETGAVRYYFDV